MANLTTRTELATYPALEDLVHIVDISDTTDDAAGTSKKISIANLLGSNVQTVETRTSLGTVTLGTAGDCFFDSISQDYDELEVVYRFRPGGGSGTRYLYAYLNEDTTDANYRSASVGSSAGGAWNFSVDYPLAGQMSGSVSNYYCDGVLRVKNYTHTSDPKFIEGHFSAFTAANVCSLAYIRIETAITAAVTQLRLDLATHGLIGEAELFGIKQATIGSVSNPGDAGTSGRFLKKIETIDNSATAGKFDFQNIPEVDGGDIYIKGWVRTNYTGGSPTTGIQVFCNNDTTLANYHRQNHYAYNGTNSAAESASNTTILHAPPSDLGSPAGQAITSFSVNIKDYASADNRKMIQAVMDGWLASGSVVGGGATSLWADSTPEAVNRVTIQSQNDPTVELYGVVSLYIEQDIVLTPGKHEIETIVADGSTITDFDFQNIPAGFKRIWIEGSLWSTNSGIAPDGRVWFNNDTTDANYRHTMVFGYNGGASGVNGATARAFQSSGSTGKGPGTFELKAENYAKSGYPRTCRVTNDAHRSSTEVATYHTSMYHQSMTAAINRITIADAASALIGELTLYVEY